MEEIFLDLEAAINSLNTVLTVDRAEEFAKKFKGVYVTAIGGFPIIEGKWCDSPITTERIIKNINDAIAISAMPTYMNRSKLDKESLSKICKAKNHMWAARWLTISCCFGGFGSDAELAFTRDTRFYMSWPISANLGEMFVANASIYNWLKFTNNYNSKDWSINARNAMLYSRKLIERLL